MIYHTDFDKAHRCPFRGTDRCRQGYVSCEKTDWHFRRLAIYECNECHARVARWPLLPHVKTEWHVFSGYVTWRQRAKWFWWEDPRRRIANWYWPRYSRMMHRKLQRMRDWTWW